jgi:hypothetical protein
VLCQVADVVLRWRRFAGQVEQDEALDDRQPHLVQREARRIEVRQPVGERRVAQGAVQAVGPRVVRALQTTDAAFGLLDQARAAMAARVQEGTRQSVVVTDHDHRFLRDFDL